jgi:hypothetical protein
MPPVSGMMRRSEEAVMSAEREMTVEDLRAVVAALGLVPVPDRLMDRVLEQARAHRASVRRFDAAGLDVADVVTAQPYRA